MSMDWKTFKHGAIEKLLGETYSVEGSLPSGPVPRRMTLLKTPSGGVVVHNAVALDEPGMKALEEIGPVEMIVVPSALHRIDGPRFAHRYPKARVVVPRGAKAAVSKVMRVDATYDEIGESIPGMSFEHLAGTKDKEGVLRASTSDGAVLVFNDAIMNLPPKMPGFVGWLMGALGSLGGTKVTRVYKTLVLSDKRALGEHFAKLAEVPNVRRIVPGHGAIIDQDPTAALRGLSASLSG